MRSTDHITDYHAGQDVVVLEAGASVRSIVDNGTAIVITLVGDGDKIFVDGAALNVADITFQETSSSFTIFT